MIAKIIMLFAALLAGYAQGADYLVNQVAGNDANPCTWNLPCKSPWRLMHVLSPGDVGHIGPGTYEGIYITVSGSAGRPITFSSLGGSMIVEPAEQAVNFAPGVAHIVFRGFNIVSLRKNAMYMSSGAHHLLIQDNVVHDSPTGGIVGIGNDYVTIFRNVIHNTAKFSADDSSAISLYQLTNVDLLPGYHNKIYDNKIHDNANFVPQLGKLFPSDGNGIIVDDSRHTQNSNRNPAYTGWTLIENNLVFNNGGRGIHVYYSDNVEVRGNTLYGNNWAAGGMWRAGEIAVVSSGGVVVSGNIVIPSAPIVADGPRYHFGLTFQACDGVANSAKYNLSLGGDGDYYTDGSGSPSYTPWTYPNPMMKPRNIAAQVSPK